MHPNAELIAGFYGAFNERDHAAMARCYHSGATFKDPAFGDLRGAEVPAMWRMLCMRATDLAVTFSDVEADDALGSAKWEATYTFGPTDRRVHNRIAAAFRFLDGKIARHTDEFDFYRWSRMAIGPAGWVLGWTPLLRKKVQSQAREQLDVFMAKEQGSAT